MFQGVHKGCNIQEQCETVYENTHISKIRHHETTLQLVIASRRNIIICYEHLQNI